MGIKGLLKQLPGGDMSDTRTGFSKLLTLVQDKSNPADFDAGTLIFVCALRHKRAYLLGDYIPAAREFMRQLILMKKIYKWHFTCIFDGPPPPEKRHEHKRRSEKEDDPVIINSTYIAMLAKVCKQEFINYVIGSSEADMQAGHRKKRTIVICRDGDLVALGNAVVILIDNWFKEEHRIIMMNTPITEAIAERYPLYAYYHKYGIKIIHWWAAVMGCDISKNASGIEYAGKDSFLDALESLDNGRTELDAKSFAKALRDHSRAQVRQSYSEKQIQRELERVSKWFSSGGTYYDEAGNIYSTSGALVKKASKATIRHMKGDLDPKSGRPFTQEQKRMVDSLETHNLLHNSAVNRAGIKGLCLPEGKESVGDCGVAELKAMVIARGGSVTGRNGKALVKWELIQIVEAYLSLERENPTHTVYFDRSRNKNGVFANIDTSERRTIPQILDGLVKCGEHEEGLRAFFADVQSLHADGKFTDDFATISLEAPEMTEDFIRQSFVHVGDSTSQKNIVSGLHKVLEMDEILYHAFAWAPDGKSIYIISKQRASQTHDEKTRQKTPAGEKPKLSEYLVLGQASVIPTTHESHGHTLGRCAHVMRTYCASCKAGLGMCNHRSGGFWMQHLHWGEGRPTPKPATASYCSWVPGMRSARTCSTLVPASCTHIEKLPESNEEAQKKLDRGVEKNMHQGISARYDIYDNSKKWEKLNNPRYVSKDRIAKLFECLRGAQSTGQDDEDEANGLASRMNELGL